jgi:parvulin-like peptidyl-prolyl isomerase
VLHSARSRSAIASLAARLALPIALVVALAACSGSGDPSTAATVDGEEIPISEIEEQFATLSEAPEVASQLEGDESGDAERGIQAQLLTELIRSQLLQAAADDLDIEVTDAQVAEQREILVESAGGEEALQQTLETSDISEDELDELLRNQVIQEAIGEQLGEEVTDEEVRAAFEADPQGQFGEQVEVRHVLTETEEEAQQAIERIESGEDFATVAQEMSIDPGSTENGGELGLVARGTTVEPFEEAAFGAEVGELVGPVESEFGFHVIEVTDRVSGPAFEDVQEEIRTQLETPSRAEAFETYIADLLERIEVDVNPRFGTWSDEQIAVVTEDPLGTPAPGASAGAPGGAPGDAPAAPTPQATSAPE